MSQNRIRFLEGMRVALGVAGTIAAYTRIDGDPCWSAIRDVVLLEERSVGDVFTPDAGHDTHFHLRLRE